MSEHLYKIVKEEVEGVKSDEGGLNSGHLWKIWNKLRPKYISNPTAIINSEGKLLTSSEDIKEATMMHFEHVLRNRPINQDLHEYKEEGERLCEGRKLRSPAKTLHLNGLKKMWMVWLIN